MKGTVAWILSMAYTKKHSGGGSETNYNNLINLPKVNGTTLTGDKSGDDLKLVDESDELTSTQMSSLLSLID